MHEMQTIVTDVRGVCPSVCLSRDSTRLHSRKTAKRIKMLFGVNTLGGPGNSMLNGGPDPPQRGGGFDAAFAKLLWLLVSVKVRLLHGILEFVYQSHRVRSHEQKKHVCVYSSGYKYRTA